MKTRGGWRETPQTHEIAVGKFDQMTEEELIARIRELDAQVRPLIDLKPIESQKLPPSAHVGSFGTRLSFASAGPPRSGKPSSLRHHRSIVSDTRSRMRLNCPAAW